MRLKPIGSTSIAVVMAAAGASLLIPGTGEAGDHKIFPGSFCQQSNTDSVALEYNYSVSGGMLQTEAPGGTGGAGAMDFSCPILRDNEANTTGFKFYAWVNDQWGENGDDDIERVVCSVSIRKSDGSGQLDWETRATGVEATGVIKLDWGTSLATGAAFAVYNMDCFVPTYSGVHSYRTDEP